jgi:hypothetical protein
MELQLGAPIFVGGGSVDGSVCVSLHESERKRHRKSMIESIYVHLIGVEELLGVRRSVFLNLGSELEHPQQASHNHQLISSSSPSLARTDNSAPFSLALPFDVGPAPFHSKHARIRYLLAVTIWLQDVERPTSARCSEEITVLSVYDRKKEKLMFWDES